ncbi:hypothetical protein POX_a00822 [Penicillium oxalicum]|uniref:Uncharacterized protein n=1 Tax=Penicillium oxalicum (strain 114-2 / CGMCC 5302) TaxID=933388 RepID=S7ZU19_PENO1|nr:hypothetical protein POX_a00822 [Penicillium oxalicum]EPS34205.1 hypothetical protein PDE_09169 [Penicillium oxalicum 114-2]KAI2794231.1 hypothetical protein POX_a00822 [Penicillium oxalicum]
MSNAGEERWRGPSRHSSQRQTGHGHRDRTGHHGGGGHGRGGHSSWGANTSTPNAPSSTQDHHVPVRGFNAMEAKNMLKQGLNESRPTFYKPTAKDTTNPKSAGGPWGSKPNIMANGKDFWLELRKQVASLQRGSGGGPPVGG